MDTKKKANKNQAVNKCTSGQAVKINGEGKFCPSHMLHLNNSVYIPSASSMVKKKRKTKETSCEFKEQVCYVDKVCISIACNIL